MIPIKRITLLLVLLTIAGCIGLFLGWDLAVRSSHPVATKTSPDRSSRSDTGALVFTKPVTIGRVQRDIVGYGIVGTAYDGLLTKSLPFECVILKEIVNIGQEVDTHDLLLQVQASQKERLAASKARAELEAALALERMVQTKIQLKLATKQDLILSALRVEQAQRVVNNFLRLGIDKIIDIRASTPGIVASISVQQGQLSPAGAALISLADKKRLIINLGVEPEEIRFLTAGQDVELFRVHSADTKPLMSRIKTVTRSVDPATRLVRVLIEPTAQSDLMLNEFIEARISIGSHECPIVPFSSVLSDAGGQYIFTVKDGQAHRRTVKTGLRGDLGVELLNSNALVGERVVTVGNHELQPGMAVRERQAAR